MNQANLRLLSAALAAALVLSAGCAAFKHQQGRSSRPETGQAGFTNRFASSVSAQAQNTAPTNAAPGKAADNTAQNKRESDSDALTPLDQGSGPDDRRITQEARKALVFSSGQHFSFSAKNIKIITINNEVTLRGVVNDEREKAAVEAVVQKIAGVHKINNQLEAKHPAAR